MFWGSFKVETLRDQVQFHHFIFVKVEHRKTTKEKLSL